MREVDWDECGNCPGASGCGLKDEIRDAQALFERFLNDGGADFFPRAYIKDVVAWMKRNA